MKNTTLILFTIYMLLWFTSCHEQASSQKEQVPRASVKTITIEQGDIENNLRLNGKTIYLKKNAVVSPIAGYVLKTNVKFGDIVQKNDVLFEIQTKENKALENAGLNTGSNGIIKVTAPSGGSVSELPMTETGGYVVEGGTLCSIVENKDLMVQVNVPFEYNTLIKAGAVCKILLTDNTGFDGSIFKILPEINEADQTQKVLIKPNTNRQLPENLNLTVQFVNIKHSRSFLVNKEAVMTNETQSEFWVMKIISDSMAVKVPVHKGIENDSIVEVISSGLNKNDLVIGEGAYGLPDSAFVKIVKKP
jgi:biotin carboxyl carrier protein